MNLPAAVALTWIACYLAGSVPFGLLAGLLRGVDVRRQGSGNIGATNVGRVLGRSWGVAVFVLDAAKGLIPTLLSGLVLRRWSPTWGLSGTAMDLLWLGSGLACIIGHNYPAYLRFRGGKGVATSLGVVLGVFPHLTVAGLMDLVVWAVVTATTRFVSLGSVSAAVLFPFFYYGWALWRGCDAFAEVWPLLAFCVLASSLVVYRHRGNLARLRAGTERKIGAGAGRSGTSEQVSTQK